MQDYLRLVRFTNLLFIVFVQAAIKFAVFRAFEVSTSLSIAQFWLLVMATISIAAAGNIINDIYDVEIDRINRPRKLLMNQRISEKHALNLYIVLSLLGVGLGFYLSNAIEKPGFAALFIIISALLYLYASFLKKILLVGNILISVLVAMALMTLVLFDVLPAITTENRQVQMKVFAFVGYYALFAFIVNLIREMVKDLADINGDKFGGKNTLAIAIGRKRTIKIVFVLGTLTVFAVVFYMYHFIYTSKTLLLYFLFGIVAPLLYFCIKAWDAKSEKEYSFLSKLLKIIMFLGIGSLLLYPYLP